MSIKLLQKLLVILSLSNFIWIILNPIVVLANPEYIEIPEALEYLNQKTMIDDDSVMIKKEEIINLQSCS